MKLSFLVSGMVTGDASHTSGVAVAASTHRRARKIESRAIMLVFEVQEQASIGALSSLVGLLYEMAEHVAQGCVLAAAYVCAEERVLVDA